MGRNSRTSTWSPSFSAAAIIDRRCVAHLHLGEPAAVPDLLLPVEHLWSVLKHNLKKILLCHAQHIDEPTWRDLVRRAWDSIEPAVFRAMVASNRQYLVQQLSQAEERRPNISAKDNPTTSM